MPDDTRFLTAPTTMAERPAMPPPPPRRAPMRLPSPGRLVRVALALALLGLAAVMLHDRFLLAEVRHAKLSGAPITLRSPIDGVLLLVGEAILPGTVVQAGTTLGLVRNPRLDQGRMAEITRLLEEAVATQRSLARRIGDTNAALASATITAEAFRLAREATLAARHAEAEASLAGADARSQEAMLALRRTETLAAIGAHSIAALDQARRTLAVGLSEQRAAVQRIAGAAAALSASKSGVFASDSAQDRSTSQQAQDRLREQALYLVAQEQLAGKRVAALGVQFEVEAAQLTLLREAPLDLPHQARLLRRLVQPGEVVRAGQDIALLADCGQPEVSATLPSRQYRHLRLGQPARFQPGGQGHWLSGHITLLHATPAGPGAPEGRFEVLVRIAASDVEREICESGRLGRLAFD